MKATILFCHFLWNIKLISVKFYLLNCSYFHGWCFLRTLTIFWKYGDAFARDYLGFLWKWHHSLETMMSDPWVVSGRGTIHKGRPPACVRPRGIGFSHPALRELITISNGLAFSLFIPFFFFFFLRIARLSQHLNSIFPGPSRECGVGMFHYHSDAKLCSCSHGPGRNFHFIYWICTICQSNCRQFWAGNSTEVMGNWRVQLFVDTYIGVTGLLHAVM